jgi:hypothetical protein
MRSLRVLFFVVTAALAARAETKPLETIVDALSAREHCDEFMALVNQEKVQEAFDSLLPHGSFSKAEASSLVLQTIRQREMVGEQYGPAAGVEFVFEQRLGASLLRLTYLEKRTRHPFVWTFLFYSADGESWRLNGINWSDKVQELF